MEHEQGAFVVEQGDQKAEIQRGTETGMPPLIVVVQGGKKVNCFNYYDLLLNKNQSGKSTLIKSLVKYYTNQNINQVRGSITIRNCKFLM